MARGKIERGAILIRRQHSSGPDVLWEVAIAYRASVMAALLPATAAEKVLILL